MMNDAERRDAFERLRRAKLRGNTSKNKNDKGQKE